MLFDTTFLHLGIYPSDILTRVKNICKIFNSESAVLEGLAYKVGPWLTSGDVAGK